MEMTETWTPATFWTAMSHGPDLRSGYTLLGLGLHHDGRAPRRQNTHWTLTHIGSGAAVCRMQGTVAMVMPVAADMARCGDWTLFDLPDGWQQTDPDLLPKVTAILEAHPEARGSVRGTVARATADDARAVIAARETAA